MFRKRPSDISLSLRRLREAGTPFASVLDVGVQTATPVLIEVFPDLTHHLFEPIDDYFPGIRENYAAISHRLVHAALADADGEVHLHAESRTGDGAVTHSWISPEPTATSRRLRAMRLDTYLDEAQPASPFLLKIDVDGAPVPGAILRGAARTLEHSSAVVIEMTVERFQERNALLVAAGFDLWDLAAPCYYGGCLWQFDAVYVSRSVKQGLPGLDPIHAGPFRRENWQSGHLVRGTRRPGKG
jgi:FkbM family methyltransferase